MCVIYTNAEEMPVEHGTNNRYVNLRCRCPECRKAHNQYEDRMRSKRKKLAFDPIVQLALKTLGGKCIRCGSLGSEGNLLTFTTIDRSSEGLGVSVRSMIYSGKSNWFEISDQLAKCELVCEDCKRGG